MEDDIKNLFQKMGKPVSGYQEINRTVVTEQARKRWPLLRDVNIHSLPGHYEQSNDDEVQLAESAPAPTPAINQVAATPRVGLKSLFKTESAQVEEKPGVAGSFFAKLQHKPEPVPEPTVASGLLNRTLATESAAVSANRPEVKSLFVATERAELANQGTAPVKTVSQTLNFGNNTNSGGSTQQAVNQDIQPSKTVPAVQSVLNRLAGIPEPEQVASVSKSFFNKIFKS